VTEGSADARVGSSHDPPGHVARTREQWDANAAEYAEPGRRAWAATEPTWGIFGVPEADVRLLPERLDGLETIELGCGTAYVSAWLARRGARPIGIDNSPAQLETARSLQQEFGIEFPLLLGDAEATPFADASFDFAISEYGAAIWCDPFRWIPEAARILRPGGTLVFLGNSTLLMLCVAEYVQDDPATDQLLRPQFGMHRFEWPDDTSVEFHLSHGDWIRVLRDSGFEVERLVELQPAADAATRYPFVTLEWARQWPAEEVWVARKRCYRARAYTNSRC
jgi:SAM-dependent methyltransferase